LVGGSLASIEEVGGDTKRKRSNGMAKLSERAYEKEMGGKDPRLEGYRRSILKGREVVDVEIELQTTGVEGGRRSLARLDELSNRWQQATSDVDVFQQVIVSRDQAPTRGCRSVR